MVLLYEIIEKKKGTNGLPDGRTRCIYENGTESDIYLQTLRKSVVASGYAITETLEETDAYFFNPEDVKQEDQVTGYIYVLRSKSENPEIRNIKNLYKIGFYESGRGTCGKCRARAYLSDGTCRDCKHLQDSEHALSEV